MNTKSKKKNNTDSISSRKNHQDTTNSDIDMDLDEVVPCSLAVDSIESAEEIKSSQTKSKTLSNKSSLEKEESCSL